jgi:transposase-like protein
MARIPSYGQIISGQCGFNQATSHPADPIKRHRARRERSDPKVVLTAQTNAVALDLLENGTQKRIFFEVPERRRGSEISFLALHHAAKVWKMQLREWVAAKSWFAIVFEDRFFAA